MTPTWISMLIFLALLSFREVVVYSAKADSSHSVEMAASLRRYLMADNYDYDDSQPEDVTSPRVSTFDDTNHKFNNNTYSSRYSNHNKNRIPANIKKNKPTNENNQPLISGLNNDFRKNTAELDGELTASPKQPKLHKNDLLYYIDDQRLTRRKGVPDYDMWSEEFWLGQKAGGGALLEDKPDDGEKLEEKLKAPIGNEALSETILDDVDQEPEAEMYPEDTTPKVKYKVIKVKTGSKSRRSQQPAYRRFLQEEREDGFAIINLDDQQFPQFRLASARRHHDSDEVLPASAPDHASELVQASDTESDKESLTRPPNPRTRRRDVLVMGSHYTNNTNKDNKTTVI